MINIINYDFYFFVSLFNLSSLRVSPAIASQLVKLFSQEAGNNFYLEFIEFVSVLLIV